MPIRFGQIGRVVVQEFFVSGHLGKNLWLASSTAQSGIVERLCFVEHQPGSLTPSVQSYDVNAAYRVLLLVSGLLFSAPNQRGERHLKINHVAVTSRDLMDTRFLIRRIRARCALKCSQVASA